MSMKNLYQYTVLLILLVMSFFTQAQPKQVTDEQLAQFTEAIEQDAVKLKGVLEKANYTSEFDKQRYIEFTLDTFKIERMFKLKLSTDYSTAGMVNAGSEMEGEYDKLLNKYYQILLARLDEKDKETLKQSQRNWIAFRDSERELNLLLTDQEYSGGGTIQSVISMSRSLELTKKRVFEIREYLGRFYQ